jgi:hypothetical protein
MIEAETRANQDAELLPASSDDERPALRLPTPDRTGYVLVFGYWSEGELVVTVDTEDSMTTVEVRMHLNDGTVFEGEDR